jgi:hypothetical protein
VLLLLLAQLAPLLPLPLQFRLLLLLLLLPRYLLAGLRSWIRPAIARTT